MTGGRPDEEPAATDFADRLRSGQVAVGTLLNSPDPSIAELLAGHFDWLFVDLEHTPTSIERIPDVVRAAELAGAAPLVRIPDGTEGAVSPILDAGAAGVIFPHVDDAESARAAVSRSKFPPLGDRSAGYGRAYGYGRRARAELTSANDRVLTVVLLESDRAVRNARDILAVPGIDVGMVGVADLSMARGLFDDEEIEASAYAHGAEVRDAIETVAEAARATDTLLALPAGDPATIGTAIESGAHLLLTGSTYATLNDAVAAEAKESYGAVPDGKRLR